MGPNPETGLYDEIDQRHADALVELAGVRLGSDPDADRATVVVHVDASALTGGPGTATVRDRPVANSTLRFLICDARIEWLVHGEDGSVLGVGRASRKVPPHMMRHLRRRDRCCRVEGCTRTWGLHAHHVEHWVDGGRTDEDNLILICRFHHRLIHRPGWRLRGDPRGRIVVIKPDGRIHRPGPRGVGAAVRERFEWLFEPEPEPCDTS